MELCNPTTLKWIKAFTARPATTLIIKSTNDTETGVEIADYIYNSFTKNSTTPLYKLELKDKKSIGIEDIRDFQSNMSLKANSDGEYTRFALIPNAETLTVEAQNALLKLTEELPDKTIVMLVISSEDNILPTLMSRCFQIKVLPITASQSVAYGLKHGIDRDLIDRSYVISEGNVSIFKKLLFDQDKSIEEIIAMAKKFITNNVYERQNILSELHKNPLLVTEFIQAIKLTSRTGMRTAKSLKSKKHWKSILSEIIITEKQLEQNVQTKLALLALSVRI